MSALVTSGVLETQVSFYTHFSDTKAPQNGTFLQIVTSTKLTSKYGQLLAQIRATDDKEKRDVLKKTLPCFTPSGTFTHRAANGLAAHSGLIQFDIDPSLNAWLNSETAPLLRNALSRLKQVAYCALSASGAGVWGVVPIAYPERHKEHFEALKAGFAGWGIVIDSACGNVDRLRFWSYDPDAYLNPEAVIYSKLISTTADTYAPRQRPTIATDNAAKVEAVLGRIEATRTDITSGGNGYEDWFSIGCALANEFGENGRDYFQRVSQYYPKYSHRETEGQFSHCLRKSGTGYTLGTFFEVARRYGIEYKNHLSIHSEMATYYAPQPGRIHAPAPSALPPGYRRERLTDRETGQPIEVLLNTDGYPAAWDRDLEPQQRASLARVIQTSPAVSELIIRFDLQFEGMNPITEESEKEWNRTNERAARIANNNQKQ